MAVRVIDLRGKPRSDDYPEPIRPEPKQVGRRISLVAGVLAVAGLVGYGGYHVVSNGRSTTTETALVKEKERLERVVSDEDYGEGITRHIAGETRRQRDERIERESIQEVLERRRAWTEYLQNETLEQYEERIRLEREGIRGRQVQSPERREQIPQRREDDRRDQQKQPQGRSVEQFELIPKR